MAGWPGGLVAGRLGGRAVGYPGGWVVGWRGGLVAEWPCVVEWALSPRHPSLGAQPPDAPGPPSRSHPATATQLRIIIFDDLELF